MSERRLCSQCDHFQKGSWTPTWIYDPHMPSTGEEICRAPENWIGVDHIGADKYHMTPAERNKNLDCPLYDDTQRLEREKREHERHIEGWRKEREWQDKSFAAKCWHVVKCLCGRV